VDVEVGGPVVVPEVGSVGEAVDSLVTVVFEGPAPPPVLSEDVGVVGGGVVEVGSSDVVGGSEVVGGSDVDVGGVSLDDGVVGTSDEVGRSVVDSEVGGGGGSVGVVTGGADVSAVEDGCSSDVGVGVPGAVGSILVLLEDMV
jgi:hypothetical protein